MKYVIQTHQEYKKSLNQIERLLPENNNQRTVKILAQKVHAYERSLLRNKYELEIPSLEKTLELYNALNLKVPIFLQPVE